MRLFAGIGVIVLLASGVFGQATPAFEIADVHVSPHTLTANMRGGVLRAGRYEILQATMVDLIRTAFGVDADKVLSGPSWLEADRFDVIAKAPSGTSPETAKVMLQGLLAERFKLVVRADSHLLPGFALTVGKGGSPKLKEADGSGDIGCKVTMQAPPPPPPPPAGGAQQNVPILILPTYQYTCHSMTMEGFAAAMHSLNGAQGYLDTGIVVDQTGLKGAWDFNFKYGPKVSGTLAVLAAGNADVISLFDAVDKQLGLKLDATKLATPVIIVESVNRKPSDNPPGVTSKLPVIPAEFEVADIRLSAPNAAPVPSPGFQPSGRVDLRNYPLQALITLALNTNGPVDAIPGLPKSLASVRVDLIAKMPSGPGGPNQGIDLDFFRPALKALLEERFKLKTHMEDRPADAYTLTAAKPKLQKSADPLLRTNCKEGPGPDGRDPRVGNPVITRLMYCQNITMAEFAEQLQRRGNLRGEVLDATGLDGAYDITLSFSEQGLAQLLAAAGRGGDAGAPGAAAGASDPSGGVSLAEALNKQLGLKLETQKRPTPTLVVDHIDEKPSDN